MLNSIQYFDKIADTYFRAYQERTPGGRALRIRRTKVLELFDKPGGQVLDVGCGPGVMVQGLLNAGCTFWGIDGSLRMIQECDKNFRHHPQVHFAVADATALAFPDECFDAVICMGVIDRIPNYALALKEMVRVLKKNGTLIISVPNLLSPYILWRTFIFNPVVATLREAYYTLPISSRKPAMGPFAKLHPERAFKKLAGQHGCQVTDVVYFNFNLLFSPLDQLLPRLAIWVADKVEALRPPRLKWLGTAYIVKAKKLR